MALVRAELQIQAESLHRKSREAIPRPSSWRFWSDFRSTSHNPKRGFIRVSRGGFCKCTIRVGKAVALLGVPLWQDCRAPGWELLWETPRVGDVLNQQQNMNPSLNPKLTA